MKTRTIRFAIAFCLFAAASSTAWALPSYSRQTGVACAQCHTVAFGPALTAYGRAFKLNGYTFSNGQSTIPLSIMTIAGYNQTGADLPDPAAPHFSNNDNLTMNELTAFFAGKITEHSGAFIEASYSGTERHTAWGAVDWRYARTFSLGKHSVVAGVTVNDNPTVSDLWNSTPVWSYPYTGSDLAPTPAAAPLLFDGISERVLGSTAYAMIDDRFYVEAGAYRSLSDGLLGDVGLTADDNLHMRGVAPYWRAALQFQRGDANGSVGLLGLSASLRPDPAVDAVDRYADVGLDATYGYSNGAHAFAANLLYVNESRHLDASFDAEASSSRSSSLDSLRVDGTYAFRQTWVASGGWFDISGKRNPALYAPAAVEGSANGSPDSRGCLVQLEYVPFGKADSPFNPWLNLRFGVQYTAYQKFNGGSSNYDGSGRSASDNDTLFLFLWAAM